MRRFDSPVRNYLFFGYRLVRPFVDIPKFLSGLYGYFWFVRDVLLYKIKDPSAKLLSTSLTPILHQKTQFAPFDAHYFFQQIWVFENLLKIKPKKHVDIASSYIMSGYISKITHAIFVDTRPIRTNVANLEVIKGDVLRLPFESNSIVSLSCLNVVEHIGLGRYGDKIDPDGMEKACGELQRILKPGGRLFFSVPVGRERLCFNAHRVTNPVTVLGYFKELKLVNFGLVDDSGEFVGDTSPEKYVKNWYSCGMYEFSK